VHLRLNRARVWLLQYDGAHVMALAQVMEKPLHTSVRLKLAVFVAAVVALTAGALSVASYVFARQTLRSQIHERLSAVASDRRKMLLQYVREEEEWMALLASRTRLRQLIDDHAAGRVSDQSFREETRRILLDAQKSSHDCRAIWLTDRSGRAITASDEKLLGQDYSATPEFSAGQRGIYAGEIRPDSDHCEVMLAAPTSRGGQVLGVMMVAMDATPIFEALADRTGLGKSGEVVIGVPVGDKLRYMLPSRSGEEMVEVPLTNAPAMAEAVAGRRGFMQTHDRRGVQVLAAFEPVGFRDWVIIAKIDAAEAYAPIAELRRMFVVVEASVFLLGLVASYLLAWRFTRPILRMANMAETIAAGRLNARVVVEAQDEIGMLGQAFNHMAEELDHAHAILEDRVRERTAELRATEEHTRQIVDTAHDAFVAINADSVIMDWNKAAETTFGWPQNEILGRRLTETIIPPRFREAHEKGVRHFLATGEGPVLNKRLELTALRRNGEELPVELTIAAVRLGDRYVFNAFLHDITSRKRAQGQLSQTAKTLHLRNRQLQEDLVMAREIQQAFLPQRYPTFPPQAAPDESPLSFCHLYRPASTLGGDFFEVFALSDTQVGMFICDVMGHGIRAALVTAIVRGLLQELRPFAGDPGQFLTESNLALIANLQSATTTIFASAFYLVINVTTGEMLYANAGHPSPFWLRRDVEKAQPLQGPEHTRGPVLGLMSEAQYPTSRQRLGSTDAVLLFTDGLYEVDDQGGNQFGSARLGEEVQKRVHHPCCDLVHELVAEVQKFSGSGEFTDDVCLVGVEAVKSVIGEAWSQRAPSALRADS
jgi:PAS domain S-box-containing protein